MGYSDWDPSIITSQHFRESQYIFARFTYRLTLCVASPPHPPLLLPPSSHFPFAVPHSTLHAPTLPSSTLNAQSERFRKMTRVAEFSEEKLTAAVKDMHGRVRKHLCDEAGLLRTVWEEICGQLQDVFSQIERLALVGFEERLPIGSDRLAQIIGRFTWS